MIIGIILTVLVGTVTLGATGNMEPETRIERTYDSGDWANE